MNIKKKLLVIIIAAATVIVVSFRPVNQKGFKITGSVAGFEDSTMIFLNDITTGSFKNMDSTWVLNGRFQFSGMIEAPALNVAIRTRDFSDRTYFWLENKDISFDGEKGKFKEAIIRGSETNDANARLGAAIRTAGNDRLLNFRFIQDHPASIISAYLLGTYCSSWGRDSTAMLYKNLSTDIRNSYYGKNISNFILLNKNPGIGELFVDFAQADINGNDLRLSDLKGKVVLLDFWASWCGPCIKENPELVKTYKKYNERGFEIYAVSADDDKQSWINAIRRDSLPWKNVSDLQGNKNKAVMIYGISRFPDNFLIDRNGVIIARDIRGEALKTKLKEIFD